MGRNPAWLSPKQVGVLQWIKDGCPTGDGDDGYERRIRARALERRGLVTIKGTGASWTASITEAGLAWLTTHAEAPTEAEVDELIRRVQEGDGRLVLPAGYKVAMAYERLVKMSHQSPSRPTGWRLEQRGRWGGGPNEIVLVRHFEDLVEEAPVPVPEHVSRYHPAVKAYLSDRHRQLVSKEHLSRAARILQAITDEAPRRGLEVSRAGPGTAGVDAYRDRAARRGHLALRAPAGTYVIRIQEVSGRSDRPVMHRGLYERSTRAAWLDARATGFVSTGILELVVDGPGMAYSGDRYRDAKTIPLEEKLPRLFRAIEVHRRYAELRAEERQREAAERQRRWEAAMAEAGLARAATFTWDRTARAALSVYRSVA